MDKQKAQAVFIEDDNGVIYTFTGPALPDEFRVSKGYKNVHLRGIGEPYDLPEGYFFEDVKKSTEKNNG